MKLRIGSFELVIHKKNKRPLWKEAVIALPDCGPVIDYACYLYDILEDDLHTGDRSQPRPDVKKLISRTLNEMGMPERVISENLPWIGTRDTVHAQIANTKLWTHKDHPEFCHKLDEMFKKFL